MKYLLSILIVFTNVTVVTAQVRMATQEEKAKFEQQTKEQDIANHSCKVDIDCAASPNVNDECNHFCKDNECSSNLQICEAYNKKANYKSVLCRISKPCAKPQKIICENNRCTSK